VHFSVFFTILLCFLNFGSFSSFSEFSLLDSFGDMDKECFFEFFFCCRLLEIFRFSLFIEATRATGLNVTLFSSRISSNSVLNGIIMGVPPLCLSESTAF
jgi:hypothetical protein